MRKRLVMIAAFALVLCAGLLFGVAIAIFQRPTAPALSCLIPGPAADGKFNVYEADSGCLEGEICLKIKTVSRIRIEATDCLGATRR